MIKIELYKDGDLVLSTDGKIDDRLLVLVILFMIWIRMFLLGKMLVLDIY